MAYPAASDVVLAAGSGVLNQSPAFTESEEIANTRSLRDRFRNKTPAGEWSFPIYLRPSGSADVPPMGDVLFEGLFGLRTIHTGTDVTYEPALVVPTFSLWLKKGHTVFFARGATVNQGRLRVGSEGALTMELSGGFMEMGWCGEDALASAIDGTTTPVTDIPVTDARKFSVGARIVVGDDDNSGAGFTITAIDYSTNTLTVSPGVATAQSAGAVVKGWLPTVSTYSFGDPIESRTSVLKINGTEFKVRNFEFTITNNIRYLEDEIDSSPYPSEKVEDRRDVSGSMNCYFRKDQLTLFYDSYQGTEPSLTLEAGEGTGGRVKFEFPRVSLNVPRVGEDRPTVVLDIDFTALGTNGEDEVKAIFY